MTTEPAGTSLLPVAAATSRECDPRFMYLHVQVRFPSPLSRQSLTLWREIMHDMFRLWCLGEDDLLSETVAYKLTDTGQGKQRVQYSPRTFKAMQVKSPLY